MWKFTENTVMKKFLLFVLCLIGAIVLIVQLDFSLEDWSLLFIALFLVRLIIVAVKSPDSGNLGYSISNGISRLGGERLSWWDDRLFVIEDDYTSGPIGWLIYRWAITIAGAISIVVWIVKFFIWLFSQPAFWITIGSLVALVIIIGVIIYFHEKAADKAYALKKEREKQFQKDCREMEKDFVETAGVPMPTEAITHDNFEYCQSSLEEIKTLMNDLLTADISVAQSMRRALIDKKLEVFYKVSFLKQAESLCEIAPDVKERIKDEFEKMDLVAIRKPGISDEDHDEYLIALDEEKLLLEDNTMAPYLSSLDKYKNMDTSSFGGLFTSSSKLAEKARIFKDIYQSAKAEYEELEKVKEEVNYMLEEQRVSAYENIYLGVELLNLVRDNSGGKSLTKADDLVEMNLDLGTVSFENAGKDSDIAGLALNSMSSFFDRIANDKKFTDYVMENPKEAIGGEALEFIGEAIRERNEAIEENNEAIRHIVEKIPEMVDAYTEGQSRMLRAIEITKALVNANKGFASIYAPLYEKVFVNNNVASVSIKDMQILAGALKEYNNIAKTKL